jgi:hypothetical protein
MGLQVPLLVHDPSGVQMSNVYMSFGTQMIRVMRIWDNQDLNYATPANVGKYKICAYANVKDCKEGLDNITYFVDVIVDDPNVNPYTVLYNKLKETIPSTVDC